jgi:hypothetical protein|tara:strand:- start:793 stop:1872 length:1080 start_codon:yes stop_codon:yes gene_type:complete
MVDNRSDPQIVGELAQDPGSVGAAQEALLGLLDSQEKPQEEEAKPSEEVTEDVEQEEPEEAEETDEAEEAEEEDAADDTDESEESEEEEAEDEEVEETALYTVKVNGEDVEVTEDELVRGYSRQADYTKKTQELAEYRKQLDGGAQYLQNEVAQTQAARQEYVNAMSQAIESNYSIAKQFENTDWERLKMEDREEYLTKRDEYREVQDKIRDLQSKQGQAYEQQNREMQSQHQQLLQAEHQKMVQILPEWGEPETQRAIAKSVGEFALSRGYTQEELNQLVDHRSILVLMEAKAFADMQGKQLKARAKKVKNKPKVVRSSAKKEKADLSKVARTKQMKRLHETGRVQDAASLFEDFVEI